MMRFRKPPVETVLKILIWIQLLSSIGQFVFSFPLLNGSGDFVQRTPSCPAGVPTYPFDVPDDCEAEIQEIYHPYWIVIPALSFAGGSFCSAVAIWLLGNSLRQKDQLFAAQKRICRFSTVLFRVAFGVSLLLLLILPAISKLLPGPYFPT